MWRWYLNLLVLIPIEALGRPQCGGTFTSARGILQTPNFPNQFPVPINCEWIIDSQNLWSPNTSIIVYLTQLFVFEGLKFTEYQVYDQTYKLNGREVHAVTENNVAKVRWLQTHQNVLVITMKLDSIEGTHLRVLDNFLDVYGFNITYEITASNVRRDSCTMTDCGFTGICYDYYTKFSCECFPGYSGPNCSGGQSSYCIIGGTPACKNGATCIHVGASAVKCLCAEGFTGEGCDLPIQTTKYNDCEDCLVSCPFNGKLENVCQCPKGQNGTGNDRIGFSSTLHLSNLPNLKGDALKVFIENQMHRVMKVNYSRVEGVHVENIEYYRSGVDVTFYLYGVRKDEKKVKSILTKWAERGYIGNLTVADKDIAFNTVLALQSVSINQQGLIRERNEFILSCVARGSPNMSFRWFKDGVFVNVTPATSDKWTRLIKDPHVSDQYTALLGVERAILLDQGIFTCQVEDYGIQQCLSKRVEIRRAPIIKIEPMSLTVQKGENFTIKCICVSENGESKYTYSWTKNRELLPVRTETEKYEILYPGGSILQVSRIDKPVAYSCLVQDELVSSEVSIGVNVVDRNLVRICLGEKHLNVLWPETAPGTESIQECPRGYVGVVRRFCSLKDGYQPSWELPDFSGCTSNSLIEVDVKFQRLRLGYEQTSALETLTNYRSYLKGRSSLLPGEGARMLTLSEEVISFINSSKDISETNVSTAILFDIIDRIMLQKDSLVNETQVILLQRIMKEQATLAKLFIKPNSVFHKSFTTFDVNMAPVDKSSPSIHIPFAGNSYPNWFSYKLHMKLSAEHQARNSATTLALVVYRNLSSFLPLRSVIRLKDGIEMEYEIMSNVAAVWLLTNGDGDGERGPSAFSEFSLAMEFSHSIKNSSLEMWNLNCAVAEFASYGYAWNPHVCHTKLLNSTTTRCSCSTTGTYAILLTTKPITQPKTEEREQRQFIVLIGCSSCLLLALVTAFILIFYWVVRRSCLAFLKIQCSVSVAGAMAVFIVAISNEPSKASFMYIMTFLESFLLIGMASQLSKLLIVYTEIVELPKPASVKQTVIGIITGVPIIAVFGNHLAHRTMNRKLESWWLLKGSLSFNIFVTCSSVIFVLFLFLYFTVTTKLKRFLVVHDKSSKALQKRIDLLRRSAYVFHSIVAMTGCSIAYVNLFDSITWHYVFGTVSIVLGFVVIFSYIILSEASMRKHFLKSLSLSKEDSYFSSDSANSPLNFFTKQEPEAESTSAPNRRLQDVNFSRKGKSNKESHMLSETMCKSQFPESVPGTFETYIHGSTSFSEKYGDSPDVDRPGSLEKYSSSPKHFRKSTQDITDNVSSFSRSPDILATKVCVELDLVASSLHARNDSKPVLLCNIAVEAEDGHRKLFAPPTITVTPDEAISKILDDSALKAQIIERQQPDGRDGISKIEEETREVPQTKKDNLDGMLDRITHDLDYLLNRGTEMEAETVVPTVVGTLRKNSKSLPPIIIEKIEEETEEEVKVPDSITDILRTSC